MSNIPQNLILHHSAVSRTQNSQQFTAIDNYHKSKGWGKIGYHYLIEPDGELKTGRAPSEIGAHCSQQLMNYRSLGICLTGSFDLEEPTKLQLQTLTKLVRVLRLRYGIPAQKLFAHRYFANYKSCPGTNFTEDLIQKIAVGNSFATVPNWALPLLADFREAGVQTDPLNKVGELPLYQLWGVMKKLVKAGRAS